MTEYLNQLIKKEGDYLENLQIKNKNYIPNIKEEYNPYPDILSFVDQGNIYLHSSNGSI